MRQLSARTLIKGTLIAILVSMIFNLSAIPAGFAATAEIKVVPPTTDIAVPTKFYVDITVTDVTNLFMWQIKLYYNPAVLTWINATYPPGHVFEAFTFAPIPPYNGSDAGGTYVLVYCTLIGADPMPTFSGSGILCRIYFEAKAQGTSPLTFSRPYGVDTFLTDPIFNEIPATLVDGSVNVVGSDTRLPTAISCNIDKSTLIIGDVGGAAAVISGAINVTVLDGTAVYIEYWNYSDVSWTQWLPIASVSTTGSQYSYTWYPEATGLLGVRSRWTGSQDYKPATSEVSNITISRSSTHIAVRPSYNLVGDRTQSLPTPTFTINVTVTAVTDLREWKIKLKFNQTIIQATEVTLPTYNVFGADYDLLEANFDNTEGFAQVGARGSAASFDGDGVLCQVRFRGVSAPILTSTYRYGISNLDFDLGFTSLKDASDAIITFSLEGTTASVRVEAARQYDSVISLLALSEVTIGDNVVMTGKITPGGAGKGADVTITYRTATMTERVLAIVKTDSIGEYSYTWNANATGTYTFKASWGGEAQYFGASAEKIVTVVEQTVDNGGPDITMYLIIGGVAAIAVIAVVVLYLVKFRKRSETPVS